MTSKSELEETFASIEKQYGTEGHPIRRKANRIPQPMRIPTGVFVLDLALLGGIPSSRISDVVGMKHSGKTMISTMIAGNAQRLFPDQKVVWVDTEHQFDPVWAEKLGCDTSQLEVVDPETAEMAVDIIDALVGSWETSLVILDSLAALIPSKEAESSVEDQFIGLQARLIGRLMRKANSGIIAERHRGHRVSVLTINQYRVNIGQMFGDPRTEPGGKAVEHFPSLKWTMKNKEKIGKDEEYDTEVVVENEHAFTITKWRGNNGPRTGEFRLCRAPRPAESITEGQVDDSKTMLSYAKKFGAWVGAGTNQRLEFEEFAQRFRNIQEAVVFLNENRDIRSYLYNWLIREQAIHMGMPNDFLAGFQVAPKSKTRTGRRRRR